MCNKEEKTLDPAEVARQLAERKVYDNEQAQELKQLLLSNDYMSASMILFTQCSGTRDAQVILNFIAYSRLIEPDCRICGH